MDSNNDKRSKMPWIEKYRPSQLTDIMSHQEIITALNKFIEFKSLPHLLFFGPSGTGKTSTIKCCAREIYGKYTDYMVLELNASNDRGIETVRTKIKNFVSNKTSIFLPESMHGLFKLVILDESDSMTWEAQGMLRQIIEKNSGTTRFCLICNDIDKLNIAIQSRCALFCFLPLTVDNMIHKLEEICQLEELQYTPGSLETIIKISKGDMRSAINILQHVGLSTNKNITCENIYRISGYCMPSVVDNIYKLLVKLQKNKINLTNCINQINQSISDNNITIFHLLAELTPRVINGTFSTNQKLFLIDNFAQAENYDAVNIDPEVIVSIISSLFIIIRNINN